MEIYRGGIRGCFCKWLGHRAGLAVAAAISGFVFFFPGRAFAASFDFKGQTVEFENAEHFEGADAQTGQPVHFLVFRQNGWFKPTATARGRALVVGGGGAGGYGTTGPSNPGGGGGEGVELEEIGRGRGKIRAFYFLTIRQSKKGVTK